MRMKSLFLIAVVGLFTSLVSGQEKSVTIFNLDADSEVAVIQNTNLITIYPGMELSTEGRLSLKAGQKISLLLENKKLTFKGPIVVDLSKLRSSGAEEEGSFFRRRFQQYVTSTIRQTGDLVELTTYYESNRNDTREEASGFGRRDFAIVVPEYISETFGEDKIYFRWDSIPTLNGYIFTIESQSLEEVIFKAKTKSNGITINLAELNIKHGPVYQWKAMAVHPDSTLAISPTSLFSYEPREVDSFISDLKDSGEYQLLEPFERMIYLLRQLELEGFYHTAYAYYKDLIQEEPENRLYQKLFAAFLVRMNAFEEARLVLNYSRP